jgi:hypothetical protein
MEGRRDAQIIENMDSQKYIIFGAFIQLCLFFLNTKDIYFEK